MVTVMTFADLYRPEPVVLSTSWQEFVLLFNSEDDQVRLRQKWDRDADPAYFVLTVAKNREDGPEGWIVREHCDSPAPMYSQVSLGTGFYLEKGPCVEDIGSSTGKLLLPGDVFYFSFPPNAIHKVFGMMLHSRGKSQEDQSLILEGPLKKPSLENLPVEISRMLLGRLSVYEALHVLPFVSTKMFNITKGGGDWKGVDFDGFCRFPSSHDMRLFADMASDTCTSLKLSGFCYGPQPDPGLGVTDIYYSLCWRAQWTRLTELHLVGNLLGFDADALKRGLKNGNFPALKVLKLRPSEGLYWRALEGCSMPNLIHLEVNIRLSDQSPDTRFVERDGTVFCNQFCKLETLGLFVVREEPSHRYFGDEGFLFPKPTGESVAFLPCLKTLMIGGAPKKNWQLFIRELSVFSVTSVTRLCLCNQPTATKYHDDYVIAGSSLFATFKHLTAVNFDSSVFLDWQSAPEAALQKLVHIRAHLPWKTPVPFEKMTSLESVSVSFGPSVSLKKLMAVPTLVALRLDGVVKTIGALKPNRGTASNIRSLNIHNLVLASRRLGMDMAVLRAFPNLTHLVVPSDLEGCADLACSLIRKHEELVELRFPEFDQSEIEKFASCFPGRSWEAFSPLDKLKSPSGSVLPCVFRARRATADSCGEVFEDPFFKFGRLL